MPQASEELRRRWGGALGVGEDKAIGYLENRGWRLTKTWRWTRTPWREPTEDELDAADFLVWEWDFGWFTKENIK